MDDQASANADLPTYPRASAQGTIVAPPRGDPPSKAMAIWSLVLACIPMPISWVVSVGLGIAVFSRSKDGFDHGKKLVIAGFIVIACWIALVVIAATVGFGRPAERDTSGVLESRGAVPIEKVMVGDCLENLREDVAMSTVEVIPCDETHRLEAYANFELPDGDWPGQGEIDRLSEGGCIKRFGDFVGKDFNDSELDMIYLRPYKEGWAVDRGVTCLITEDSPRVGTLERAGR